ncbi:helix-turn-helix domain-containing protein [Nonomuraea bangladeshensis]|uniref:helix-turn-helix domain-containing protein n=1 Tax=Nonomuraea bangladeshensis TaxID=404385 RepID=UPI0031DFF85B
MITIMASRRTPTLTGGQGLAERAHEGRISGHTLKIIRQSVGLTQERFAERLQIDVTTVQGWESGRRPLMAIPMATYLALRQSLLQLDAHPQLVRQLDTALEADQFIGHVLNHPTTHVADEHPLASWVINRTFTEFASWPLTANPPSAFRHLASETRRRGPAAPSPALEAGERAHFFEHLKIAAESATDDEPRSALLRRQAYYVASFDESPDTGEWLASMQRSEMRRLRRTSEWTPSWAVVRSGAHSLARLGDREGLQEFISTRLSDDVCEMANLNYWAYWLGEASEPQVTDLFMIELGLESWQGTKLLRHLANRLEPVNPYMEVVTHTLWALIMLRPDALSPSAAKQVIGSARQALDFPAVSDRSRRELEAVVYALRMIDRG